MSSPLNHLCVYTLSPSQSPRHFVEFWADRYNFADERRYSDNIGPPHTPDRLLALFRWKFRWFKEELFQPFLSRLGETRRVVRRLSVRGPVDAARDFLGRFTGGNRPIWRIFWLHCWDQRFPLYDQHVHRAMNYIQMGRAANLPTNAEGTIRLYLDRYLPFFASFMDAVGDLPCRTLDQALWRFGLSLRDENLPPPSRVRNRRRNRRETDGP